jgi:hypothetical protein
MDNEHSSVHRKTNVFTHTMYFEKPFLKNSFSKLPTFPFVLLMEGCPHSASTSVKSLYLNLHHHYIPVNLIKYLLNRLSVRCCVSDICLGKCASHTELKKHRTTKMRKTTTIIRASPTSRYVMLPALSVSCKMQHRHQITVKNTW